MAPEYICLGISKDKTGPSLFKEMALFLPNRSVDIVKIIIYSSTCQAKNHPVASRRF
jgi:hypothetical protein